MRGTIEFVVPGFIESHDHIVQYGATLSFLDITPFACPTLKEALQKLKQQGKPDEDGWIYAMVGGPIPRMLQLLFLSFCASLTRESRKFRVVAEGPNKGLADLKELIEAGKLVPIVDRTYQLSEVPEALRYFGEGRHKGKIVIAMER